MAANLTHAQKLANLGFIRQETFQKASKSLINSNETSNQTKSDLLSLGFEFANNFLTNYWHLKPFLSQKVDIFIRDKFRDYFIIGLQIRNDYLGINELELFVKCAKKIENERRNLLGNRLLTKWFISTDSGGILERLKEKYGEHRIIHADGAIAHVAYRDVGYERALLDIEILSRCNETVLTGGSTFGFISVLKSQKLSYYVEGKRNESDCRRFELFAPPRTPGGAATF